MDRNKDSKSPFPKTSSWRTMLALVLSGIVLVGCAGQPLSDEIPEGSLMPGEGEAVPTAVGDPTILGPDQLLILAEFGWPHSFTVLETLNSENERARYETWSYYDGGISYVFLDGEFQFREYEEVLLGDLTTTPYHPDGFVLGQSIEDVKSNHPEVQWTRMDVLEEASEGIETYISELIILGFEEGRLISVAGLALSPEEGGGE